MQWLSRLYSCINTKRWKKILYILWEILILFSNILNRSAFFSEALNSFVKTVFNSNLTEWKTFWTMYSNVYASCRRIIYYNIFQKIYKIAVNTWLITLKHRIKRQSWNELWGKNRLSQMLWNPSRNDFLTTTHPQFQHSWLGSHVPDLRQII